MNTGARNTTSAITLVKRILNTRIVRYAIRAGYLAGVLLLGGLILPSKGINATIDATGVALAGYIVLTGVGRLAMMGWKIHRKKWQIIYLMIVMWAAGNALLVFDGKGHAIPVLGLMATAAWLFESRNRWRQEPPIYMRAPRPNAGAANCRFFSNDRRSGNERRNEKAAA